MLRAGPRLLFFLAATLFLDFSASAQDRLLTLDDIYELQKAGKQFEFMTYPKSRHGVTDPRLVRHMREMMLKFVVENL
jgi:hypothetical protein